MACGRKFVCLAIQAGLHWCIIESGALADAPTRPASTRPLLAGRDTPTGSMTFFAQAIQDRDLPAVVDSYNLPQPDGYMRAAEQIADAQLYRALESRFGAAEAGKILGDARIQFASWSRKFSPDDWTYPPNRPDCALGKSSTQGAESVPTMQKGPDGIWRIGPILAPREIPPALAAAMKAKAVGLATKYDPIVAGLQAGKYTSADTVMNALFPPNSTEAQARAAQRYREQLEKKQQDEAVQQLLTMQFDSSTLDGAAGAYAQLMVKKDLHGMVRFYYVDKAKDDRFAQAYAKRILSATALDEALREHLTDAGQDSLANDFGLMPELPTGIALSEQGDRGIGTRFGPDQKAMWFRKVDGVWKQDITPQAPTTANEAAQATEEDNAAVERIASDIIAGKYRSVAQVRDALGQAMLNATPDQVFVLNDMQVSDEPVPAIPQNPTGRGPQPQNRDSPAGAMNVFARAIKTSDAGAMADSLYMPEDKDGSCRQAAAQDLIVGYRFLVAAEARFGKDAAQPISYWCGSLQPYVLEPYFTGDWLITDEYPDLAFLDSVSGSNGNFAVRSHVMVHRCSDGIWRVGPRFPKNARQIHTLTASLTAKTAAMERAIEDFKAGKYASPEEAIQALSPNGPDDQSKKLW
jgi:hypothetical protein